MNYSTSERAWLEEKQKSLMEINALIHSMNKKLFEIIISNKFDSKFINNIYEVLPDLRKFQNIIEGELFKGE